MDVPPVLHMQGTRMQHSTRLVCCASDEHAQLLPPRMCQCRQGCPYAHPCTVPCTRRGRHAHGGRESAPGRARRGRELRGRVVRGLVGRVVGRGRGRGRRGRRPRVLEAAGRVAVLEEQVRRAVDLVGRQVAAARVAQVLRVLAVLAPERRVACAAVGAHLRAQGRACVWRAPANVRSDVPSHFGARSPAPARAAAGQVRLCRAAQRGRSGGARGRALPPDTVQRRRTCAAAVGVAGLPCRAGAAAARRALTRSGGASAARSAPQSAPGARSEAGGALSAARPPPPRSALT